MFIADAHADTLYALAVEEVPFDQTAVTLSRLQAGGVGLETFALFCGRENDPGTPESRAAHMLAALEALSIPRLKGPLPERPPRAPHAILSIEGCEILGGDLDCAARYAEQGVRMASLVWNYDNGLGCPAALGHARGLTPKGRALIERLDALGILTDVSHLNDAGIDEVLKLSKRPVVATHSNARAVCDNPRNLTDAHIRAIAERGGFIGLNFYPKFLNGTERAAIADVLRHLSHMAALGAIHHVGFGSDFDGIECAPEGLRHPGHFPALLDAIRAEGYSESEIEGIAGLNLWRVLRAAQPSI